MEDNKEHVNTGNTPLQFDGEFKLPERFAVINKMIMRDLNHEIGKPKFYLYNRDKIALFLKDPYRNQKQLRDAVIYMYGASSHFRRLVQYFVSLSDLAYVVSPYKIDTTTANKKSVGRNYRRVLNLLTGMDIKNSFEKILTVCFREDVFYGTIRETTDSSIIQQLPSDYCQISTIEDNVLNVTFDFSYFDAYPDLLGLYPEEFAVKYRLYKTHKVDMRWQELDSPNSFAIKCNKDILSYALPPLIGLMRELYDLEDLKGLRMSREEIENFALLVMNLELGDNGEWRIDYNKAKEFFHNLDSELPEEIGAVLSPMPIEKIGFERTHPESIDTIAQAEQELFTAAGVSSLLFNNPKASSNSLLLSIKADQQMTYSVVKSLECMLNRFIRRHSYGKYFRVSFLDVSIFTRKEVGDAYLRAATYGLPTLSYYMASQGISQDEIDCLNFLEDGVLELKERLKPLLSSATMSSGSGTSTGTTDPNDPDRGPGRPQSDIGDLSDEGERSRERGAM